jgi:hypothetical protein
MVKLAICISGHSRNYKECFESINEQILSKYDCDVFISTYTNSDETINDIKKIYKPKLMEINDEKSDSFKDTINNYQKKLHPVKYKDCPLDLSHSKVSYKDKIYFEEDNICPIVYTTIFYNALCQFYGIYESSQLCKQYIDSGVKYDYIIRLRLDNYVKGIFKIIELKEDEVMINLIYTYSKSVKVHDSFFMARPNTFFKVANLYNNLNDIINYINDNNYWLPVSGYQETLLFINIVMQNIEIIESKEHFFIENSAIHLFIWNQ